MFRGRWAILVAWLAAACGAPPDTAVRLKPSTLRRTDPTASERLAACALDPRVRAGALSAPACAAGELFAVRLAAVTPPPGAEAPGLPLRSAVRVRARHARARDRTLPGPPRPF